jgi:anti-anti-sigma factor
MARPYRFIDVERRGEVFCVHLRHARLDEAMIHEMAGELRYLVLEEGCRHMALSLGPKAPECLYSVFLAKLISLQRFLRDRGGELALCEVQPMVREIFEVCCVDRLFPFCPSFEAAVAHWTA